MRRVTEKTKEVIVNHEMGEYSADITFELWRENYGADADGNRGVMMDMEEIVDISNFKKDGAKIDENDVPKEVMMKFEETNYSGG